MWRGLVGAVVGIGIAAFAVANGGQIVDFLDDKLSDQPYKAKLGEVKDEFGPDAKVVSIVAGTGGATFEIKAQGEKVQIRKFNMLCSGAGDESCQIESEQSSRGPLPGDRATVPLDDFDKGLVSDMCEDAGIDVDQTLAAFDGARWTLTTSEQPPRVFIAAPDGGNLRPAG